MARAENETPSAGNTVPSSAPRWRMTKARLREVVEQTVELAKSVATVPVEVMVRTELDERGRRITVIRPYYQTHVMGGVQEYKRLTLAWVQAVPLGDRRRIMILTGVGVLPD